MSQWKDVERKEMYYWESFDGKENIIQECLRLSVERRVHNIKCFSSFGDPLKNRDNGGDNMTKDDSVVDGEDPSSCILPVNEVKKMVGDNLICGMWLEDKTKLLEENY